MDSEVILVRAVEGSQVGWLVIGREEFLKRIDLESWSGNQMLIGTILPPANPPRWVN
jgi:hypothetical protein